MDGHFQEYWWFLVSLLGALLVSLMFVQGANSLLGSLGGDADGRRSVMNATDGKWIFAFIALVLFGGAFYAAFPLCWSDSFGDTRWLWMIVVLSFVLQAVGYVCRNRVGKGLGERTVQFFLVQNGFVGPVLIGGGFATFFEGSNLLHLWVLVFGLAVFFLARILGTLYIISAVDDAGVRSRASARLLGSSIAFVVLFVAYLVHLLLKDGYVVMWYLLVLLLVGIVLVLYGIIREIVNSQGNTLPSHLSPHTSKSFYHVAIGTVLIVLALLLGAG